MDWFTLVLIFIFFILPILQRVLEQKRGIPPTEAPDESTEADWTPPLSRRDGRIVLPRGEGAAGPGGWADDWGSWPGTETVEVETEREEARPEAVVPRSTRSEEPYESMEPTYSPPPVSAPPKEQAPIESAEERFRRITAAKAAGDAARTSAKWVISSRESITASHARRELGLRTRSELRRAIVLSEVLGQPLATRPPKD